MYQEGAFKSKFWTI